ncbi:phage host specificity protein [Actibacterium mucosum KCTC 23349]|uniref:Phage host specificity protein n=1 Tax=Actibacterium mucosum KCTC 23349 TaxID=1454373 RepID=A0A037ZM17_9RHOB|nr:glycoside hydrolase/phage tail family protein [Actibacterium mucosum]KAJ56587.1 phage host specificity protein [Actibacterium mucosum KCTC 23349]
MATLILSAVGAAAGSAIGGSVLGVSSAVIGRAIGATLGRVIDQKLLGTGSQAVETGRVDQFRLTGASEGRPIGQVMGRVRVSGQVIWSSRFLESSSTTDLGKGAPEVTEFSYSVSLAVALCEGEISRVGRIWADGLEVGRDGLNISVYNGSQDQLPDPRMEAIEGTGNVPAYRGLAYVVIEDLPLGKFGNRVPQFSFEVIRPVSGRDPNSENVAEMIEAVALIPGTGEYALATQPEHYGAGIGVNQSANVNSPSGKTDFLTSLDNLEGDLPNCGSALLVSCWFGDDLRIGNCTLRPKVEQNETYGEVTPWIVSGETRATAGVIPRVDDKPVYGGTPNDAAMIDAISTLRERGKDVVFYPFILMEQLEDNTLPDPYSVGVGQAVLPWRGRITSEKAPGVAGSPDGTQAAADAVADFMGAAQPSDFTQAGSTVIYTGPAEWSYRRFILHYANLCAMAGGVDAFCIGSEMRGMTQIRGTGGSFPAVEALIQLAADVRDILGQSTKITYAADWSEYFGYHPQDGSGDVYFHLDPLWADENIDVIGIDNYMPLSDWRDGFKHADADAGAIHNLQYLKGNIEGGEGYDWYYDSIQARDAQRRTPITDEAHDEPWVFRYKDIRNWWRNPHHDRVAGSRQPTPTAWVPQSKPVWFTEYGCAAIEKGTNQPNKFLDPKSSESSLPHYSTGARDDTIQAQYLRAMNQYWNDPANNPVSELTGAAMIDMSHAHVWAWDTRPYPYFPANTALWSDGENYARGHWLNGRATGQSLAAVVESICAASGVSDVDVSALFGVVRGYALEDINGARAALQPLMLAYGFDAVERDGKMIFANRDGKVDATVQPPLLVAAGGNDPDLELSRSPQAETAGRVRVNFVEADADFEGRTVEAIFPDEESRLVTVSDLPLVLTQAEGRVISERWLAESRVARDRARFALPISRLNVGAGDVVEVQDGDETLLYRLDRVAHSTTRDVEAVRIEPEVYVPADAVEGAISLKPFVAPVPVFPQFLDLPLLTGQEVPHAPHIAVTATPWPGTVSVLSAPQDSGYTLNTTVAQTSVIGTTETPLFRATPGLWDRGQPLRMRVYGGTLKPVSQDAVLNGANAMAIGDGSANNWEVFQFAEVTMVGDDTYEVSLRLRGQAGTDGVMPDVWPAGSTVVLLNGVPQQINLLLSERGLARNYRIGPAGRPFDDPSYVHTVEAFDGIGLRPYAPAHLRATSDGAGGKSLSWIRRTRVDGDSWAGFDVPLGEATEAYQLRVRNGADQVVRTQSVLQPLFNYTAAMIAADGVTAPYAIEVAQLSDSFGPGLFKRIDIDG